MSELANLLEKDFVVVDLGAAGAKDLKRLRKIFREITLVELDITTESKTDTSCYFKRISIKKAIAGKSGKRVFYERAFPDCSSFLEPKADLIQEYGLEKFFKLRQSCELECCTLPELLGSAGLHRVDFLKTDLEGLDYEVLTSASEILASTLVVQSEVRFQPFYHGEASFFTVGNYLTNAGFELISMLTEPWKYNTPRRDLMRDGRLTYADTVFFLSPERVVEMFGAQATKAFVKQILIASALGLENYAEHLFGKVRGNLSPALQMELDEYVKPRPSVRLGLIHAANLLTKLKLGWPLLPCLQRAGLAVYQSATFYSFGKHVAPRR